MLSRSSRAWTRPSCEVISYDRLSVLVIWSRNYLPVANTQPWSADFVAEDEESLLNRLLQSRASYPPARRVVETSYKGEILRS